MDFSKDGTGLAGIIFVGVVLVGVVVVFGVGVVVGVFGGGGGGVKD